MQTYNNPIKFEIIKQSARYTFIQLAAEATSFKLMMCAQLHARDSSGVGCSFPSLQPSSLEYICNSRGAAASAGVDDFAWIMCDDDFAIVNKRPEIGVASGLPAGGLAQTFRVRLRAMQKYNNVESFCMNRARFARTQSGFHPDRSWIESASARGSNYSHRRL